MTNICGCGTIDEAMAIAVKIFKAQEKYGDKDACGLWLYQISQCLTVLASSEMAQSVGLGQSVRDLRLGQSIIDSVQADIVAALRNSKNSEKMATDYMKYREDLGDQAEEQKKANETMADPDRAKAVNDLMDELAKSMGIKNSPDKDD